MGRAGPLVGQCEVERVRAQRLEGGLRFRLDQPRADARAAVARTAFIAGSRGAARGLERTRRAGERPRRRPPAAAARSACAARAPRAGSGEHDRRVGQPHAAPGGLEQQHAGLRARGRAAAGRRSTGGGTAHRRRRSRCPGGGGRPAGGGDGGRASTFRHRRMVEGREVSLLSPGPARRSSAGAAWCRPLPPLRRGFFIGTLAPRRRRGRERVDHAAACASAWPPSRRGGARGHRRGRAAARAARRADRAGHLQGSASAAIDGLRTCRSSR